MPSIEIESIFVLSQVVYFGRLWVQTVESRKRKLSVNPKLFWVLTIIASFLMGVYGFLIGSWAMPVANLLTIFYSIYHYKMGA